MKDNDLSIILGKLRQTSRKYDKLYQEAAASLQGQDRVFAVAYIEKLFERGRLLANLEQSVAAPLAKLKLSDGALAREIENKVGAFSRSAKRALETKDVSWLGSMLKPKDSKNDEDDLKKLIKRLDSRIQKK